MVKNEHFMVRNETTHGQEWNEILGWSGLKLPLVREDKPHD
jgi:hypothetical protein